MPYQRSSWASSASPRAEKVIAASQLSLAARRALLPCRPALPPAQQQLESPAEQQQAQLPEEVAVCILRHMPLQQRLRCALVCHTWAAAAAKVPAIVICGLDSSEQSGKLQHWLGKHGGVVEVMHCASQEVWPTCPLLQLPVPKLTQLRSLNLYRIKSQLAAQGLVNAADHQQVAAVLPQSQKLGLRTCHLTVQLATQLLSTTALTQLQWDEVRLDKDDLWAEMLMEEQGEAIMQQQLQLSPHSGWVSLL